VTSLVMLAVAALAAPAVAATSPAASKAKPPVMVVQVETPKGASKDVLDWAKELRTALAARKDEFRLARAGEKAELEVRIESVVAAEGNTHSMSGAMVLGDVKQPFNLSYPDDSRSQAEKLARNLRRLADQIKAGQH
jgi:hypothetical protein